MLEITNAVRSIGTDVANSGARIGGRVDNVVVKKELGYLQANLEAVSKGLQGAQADHALKINIVERGDPDVGGQDG